MSMPASKLKQDDIVWHTQLNPRHTYRIQYRDKDGSLSERIIDLARIGTWGSNTYYGVFDRGQFKSFRMDRVASVLEQITTGHPCAILLPPTYSTVLPAFPVRGIHTRIPYTKGHGTWGVDLNTYTCTCPERRRRIALGFHPGQLGMICRHIAVAILEKLPTPPPPQWTAPLLAHLANPIKTHIDSLEMTGGIIQTP